MMNLAEAGLLLIAIAWIIQLVFSWKGSKEIHPAFIVCYMIGVIGMVVSDYVATSKLSYFELMTLIAAGALLIRILAARR